MRHTWIFFGCFLFAVPLCGCIGSQPHRFEASLSKKSEIASSLLERGLGLYTIYCQRCHGEDGSDTTYPGTTSLVNIADRLNDEEIATQIKYGGFVDALNISKEDIEALVAYLKTFRHKSKNNGR